MKTALGDVEVAPEQPSIQCLDVEQLDTEIQPM